MFYTANSYTMFSFVFRIVLPLGRSWSHAKKMKITCLRYSSYTAIGWDKECGDPYFFHSSFLPFLLSGSLDFNLRCRRAASRVYRKNGNADEMARSHTLNSGSLRFVFSSKARPTLGNESSYSPYVNILCLGTILD